MTPETIALTDETAGTFALGGELRVRRLGFGAMRITGEGIWGQPEDRDEAIATVRRAVELGVNLIDTADSYGPNVSEELIAEALHPYPEDLVIATKGGLTRAGPGQWSPDGRPEHLREACEGSLKRLQVDRIDLYQLHSPDSEVPYEESVGAMKELRDEGKVNLVGVSNVSTEQLERRAASSPWRRCRTASTSSTATPRSSWSAARSSGLGSFPGSPSRPVP
jgi:pyridoxine 4-dehydrogenase